MRPEGAVWEKTDYNKSRETVPLIKEGKKRAPDERKSRLD